MRDYHINIFYSEDDEGYIADIPDLEACSENYGWKLHGQKVNLFHRQNIARLFIR